MASARQHRPPTGRGDLSALLSDPDLGSPTPDPSSVALAVNLQKFRSSISVRRGRRRWLGRLTTINAPAAAAAS